MRLIDADEFKKQIAGMAIANNYPTDKANKICELIDCQPTAYDADKVLYDLKEAAIPIIDLKMGVKINGIQQTDDAVLYGKAVEIVKPGGVAND